MQKSFKPGEECPRSGQWRIKGTPYEVTVVEDKKFPPTQKPGQKFVLADPTKHKSGK